MNMHPFIVTHYSYDHALDMTIDTSSYEVHALNHYHAYTLVNEFMSYDLANVEPSLRALVHVRYEASEQGCLWSHALVSDQEPYGTIHRFELANDSELGEYYTMPWRGDPFGQGDFIASYPHWLDAFFDVLPSHVLSD
jgi:hypothetical protein